jgi:two-component system sensor histidine kinase BaeS
VSLQRRVLGYLALAAVASCALTFAVAVVLVRHRISAQRMATLESQANILSVVGGAPGALRAGDHVYRVGSGTPKRVRPRVSAAVLAVIPAGNGQGTVDAAGRSLLYAARTTATGRVILVRPARLAFAEWRPFLVSLGLAALGGALLAVMLSYALARRLTRPIGVLSSATTRLAAGEVGVTVPVGGDDELAGLGRAFNDMSGELERAREAQRAFLESVSHELKTPLTSIRGYAEALEEGAVAPVEGGRVIGAESDRLERLVFDLLDLARLGRAGFEVRHDPVDLAAIAAAAVQRHLPRARKLGVSLTSDGPDHATGLGDADRLHQAVSNLIENALRLTPAGGSVTVSSAPGEIAVRDTGPGLSPEDLPHAFERFYLYDRYRSERAVGSGLGLAIVKELVAVMGGSVSAAPGPGSGTGAMGGSVSAAPGPGSGAVFTLRIPVGARSRDRGRS